MHHSCMCSQFPKRCVHTLESVERFGGVLTVRTRLIPVSLRAYMCVLCAACVFGRGERDKEKRRQSFLWRQPLISVPLCTCVCVCEPTPGVLEADETVCLYPGLTEHPLSSSPFPLLSSLPRSTPPSSRPPPQPLFVTTAILKAIHAAPRLSSCIAAFSPAPRFLFFSLKPFIRLEQTGVGGGEDG